jgi:Asp-tRNA(Asn)/Glu-tRNA(Gln) amidotransferase A subunit family amidase
MNFRILLWFSLGLSAFAAEPTSPNDISSDSARVAQPLLGLDFSTAKIDMAVPGLRQQLKHYQELRNVPLPNNIPPCLWFNPVPAAARPQGERKTIKLGAAPKIRAPKDPSALAYCSVRELGILIKSQQITSEQLTRAYLDRLRIYGPKLACVVTLTADLALKQARRADAELAAGKYRGPLHGIPYAAKDLFAVKGIPTTWGAAPYTNQVFDEDATVIKRLEQAGAVLVAKTSLGELAMGDVWFGGTTLNPWNTQQGSSGSSAGSAAGVAAGLFAFALGSETYGSIVSPCDRCGVTGLRPTFGRVSRAGAMSLSWSMDKIGPICRTAEDCAIILDAIQGPDGIDQSVQDVPFNYDSRLRLKKLRVGYLKSDFENETGERKRIDETTLNRLRALGADLVPAQFPAYPLEAISMVLSTEAATAFDELTRSGQDDWLKQQEPGSWPNTFREHRFVTAVEYLQAQRARYLLIQDTARAFANLDLVVAPSWSGQSLLLGNLTGHPCVVLPNGFSENATPTTVCFIGSLFGEAKLLAAAKEYQEATDFHRRHPTMD